MEPLPFALPVAYYGNQNAVLPGALEPPSNSSLIQVPAPRRTPEDVVPVDAKASTVLNTIQVPPDALNAAFFSQTNINALQQRLVDEVMLRSRIKIQKQSENDLILIMRSIYMMHRETRPSLAKLNGLVLRDALDSILGNLDMYATYASTEERMKNVLPYGINTNVRGTRTMY